MIRGRPIRFLLTIMGGWTAMRVVMLWPMPADILTPQPLFASREPLIVGQGAGWMFPQALWPGLASGAETSAPAMAQRRNWHVGANPRSEATAFANPSVATVGGWSCGMADRLLTAQMAFIHTPRPPLALASFAPGIGLSPGEMGAPAPDRGTARTDRWAGTAWMLWRRDGDPGLAGVAPQLAGAQAGMRIDYRFASSSTLRPMLYGRVSTALHGIAAPEAAAGVAIRPTLPFPAIVAVERREAVSAGGRSDFAVLTAVGVNPMPVGHGFRLDGYGQAGLVGVERRDAFADGRLTLERPFGEGRAEGRTLAIGGAIWGGAQPGASRIDMGPQLSMRVRLGGAAMRIGAEWRERVAGNAAPSSGPAFSLGADF